MGCVSSQVFLRDFVFQSSFRFAAKSSRKYRNFSLPAILHRRGALVQVGPTLLYHDHPKSVVYIGVHPCCCVSVAGTRPSSVIQNRLTALESLCSAWSDTPWPRGHSEDHQPFYCLQVLFLFPNALELQSHSLCSLFRPASLTE